MASRTFNDVKINVTLTKLTDDSHALDPNYVPASGDSVAHASNIGDPTQLTSSQDLSKALGKIQNWYMKWNEVVWSGVASGVKLTSGSYTNTLATATLSGNVTQTFPATTGTVLNTGTTSVTQVLSSGTKIATLKINNVSTDLYAPTDTDTKVNVTLATTTKAYLLGTSTTPTGTAQAVTSVGDTGVFLTTTAGRLQAGTYAITSGNYAHILKAGSTNLTANAEHIFPNTGGTVLNTGTTSWTAASGAPTSSTNGAYSIGTLKINGSSSTLYGKDTTYTFAEGSTNGAFSVTPVGGSAQTVKIHGLGSMAYQDTGSFVPMKPDGTTDLYDSNKIINSKYLPSYVDDVIEGYYKPYDDTFTQTSNATFTVTSSQPSDWSTKYTNYFTRSGTSPNYVYTHVTGSTAPTWAASTYYALTGTTETGESGKIYVDLGEDPADPYRWSGSTYVSMRSPEINAVANVVAGGTNGHLTVSYTNGSTSSDVTAYTHPTTAGNKHIPSSGSDDTGLWYDQGTPSTSSGHFFLAWGGSSGTAKWTKVYPFKPAASSSTAGLKGFVPAPGTETYAAGTSEDPHRYYLRSDGNWSDKPVTDFDILTLNVIAAS